MSLRRFFTAFVLAGLAAAPSSWAQAPEVSFAVIKTGRVTSKEGLLFSGGSFSQSRDTNFSAFLVKHGETLFLMDAGLGSKVDQQYDDDMPYWNRIAFKYEKSGLPVRAQLDAAAIGPIRRIVLSHAHWDHASGLEDFPEAEVWLSEEEHGFVRDAKSRVGTAWPSQVSNKAFTWKDIAFDAKPHEGFERSLDMFGDGRVVLVPMYGHTPGSVGMFVTVSSGRRYFFVGDVVWAADALKDGRPKFWAARWLVDHDSDETQAVIERIRAAMQRDPSLVVVPAHDAKVQDALGYFPAWVK